MTIDKTNIKVYLPAAPSIYDKNMPGIDVSKLEPVMLKENYLVFLIFPQGFVPLKVVRRELVFYQYDPVKEGMIPNGVPASTSSDGITNLGYVAPTRPGSNKIGAQPLNVLRVTENDRLFQVFFGIDPPQLRVFFAMPPERNQRQIDVIEWSEGYPSHGWIDGFTSPIDAPSPLSEIIIPPNIDVAFGFANPLPYRVHPLLMFVINRMKVKVVKDVETIVSVLEGRKPAALKTIGGLADFSYDITGTYGIRPIPLDATRTEIAQILGVKG